MGLLLCQEHSGATFQGWTNSQSLGFPRDSVVISRVAGTELRDWDSAGVQRMRVSLHRRGNGKEEGPRASSLAEEALLSRHFLSGGSRLLHCSGSAVIKHSFSSPHRLQGSGPRANK